MSNSNIKICFNPNGWGGNELYDSIEWQTYFGPLDNPKRVKIEMKRTSVRAYSQLSTKHKHQQDENL